MTRDDDDECAKIMATGGGMTRPPEFPRCIVGTDSQRTATQAGPD